MQKCLFQYLLKALKKYQNAFDTKESLKTSNITPVLMPKNILLRSL